MPQQPVELILMRQLASSLVMPIFIVSAEGQVVFLNEAAEHLFGRRFDEIGQMNIPELSALFEYWDDDGKFVPVEDRPVATALAERKPVHRTYTIRALDNTKRRIAYTAVPLVGQSGRFLGVVGIFWEEGDQSV